MKKTAESTSWWCRHDEPLAQNHPRISQTQSAPPLPAFGKTSRAGCKGGGSRAGTTAQHFEMVGHKNSDGTPVRWRRNGATKTWKTRPDEFRIPIKHGLYDYGYIDQDKAHQFVA